VEFRILGPPELIGRNGSISLPGRRQRTVLAMMLANAHHVVPLDHLVDAVWDDRPPATAKRQIQNCVAALRRLLAHNEPGEPPIYAEGTGYRIMPGPDELDAQVFQDRVAAAHQLAAEGALLEAATEVRSALALWRGPALLGLTGSPVAAAAARLDEQRLAAHELHADVELRLGHHDALIGELTELVAANPLRESLVGQLMRALQRSGRQAEAIHVYHRLRALLSDELGIDPNASIQQLYTVILSNEPIGPRSPASVGTNGGTGDGGTAGTPGAALQPRPVPAELPADAAGFTGRTEALATLDDLLPGGAGHDRGAVMISAITGTAGVGKTALAVHWAHRVKDRFPDGQLYVNLRGFDAHAPMSPIEALAQLLHALGVPAEQTPTHVQTATGLYRSLLAGQRALIVLDNAANAEQIRPLLPGTPGCQVVVTSRDRLSGLIAHDGARRLTLDVLSTEEADRLLTRVLGRDRVATEPTAAAELAEACSFLPLALRVAAANVANQPWSSLAEQVAALRGHDGLTALDVEGEAETGVRRAFDRSYEVLDRDARRLFRFVGLVACPELTVDAASALVAAPERQVRQWLNRLVAGHLIHEAAPGRYTCHDLLRQYAAGRAEAHDSVTQRRAAQRRIYGWYLHCADAAAKALYPHRLRLPVPEPEAGPTARFDDFAAALAWLDGNRAELAAAVRHAGGLGLNTIACLLADTMRGYFRLRRHVGDWTRAAGIAMAAADADGNPRLQVSALLSLGDLHQCESGHRKAIEYFDGALAVSQRCGWKEAEAAALGYLGPPHRELGRVRQAADYHSRALRLYRELGSAYGEAVALDCLGRTYRLQGWLAEAADCYERALRLYRETGSAQGEVIARHDLGEMCHALNRLDEAAEHLTEALALAQRIGDRCFEAYSLSSLSALSRDLGHDERAVALGEAARGLARELGETRAEAVAENALGASHSHANRHREALAHHRRALEISRAARDRYTEVEALIGLSAACRAIGDAGPGVGHAEEAAAIAYRLGFEVLDARARALLQPVTAPSLAAGRY
jgi:DNA-binding SARP family transcriptional activator